MSTDFLKLPNELQTALIKSAGNSLGLIDAVIEKDLWVCTLLELIFLLPYKMVFRGGTSLSKAYGLINRFSEDVDITIDYRHFNDSIDLEHASRSQLKKISSELKSSLIDLMHNQIMPNLREQLRNVIHHPKAPTEHHLMGPLFR
jgi:predicted nucleotidyltransferase component of viral defense system